MKQEEIEKFIQEMPDEVLKRIQFSMPWQYDSDEGGYVDPDGFVSSSKKEDPKKTRDELQEECWIKFHRNPQINTAVRGRVGRLTGMDFEISSGIPEINEVIEEIELDPRNRLYNFWPKFVGRADIEGELFLCLTCHTDGFIEVDFIDPSDINEGGDDNSGIIFHPTKTTMPLFYNVSRGMNEKEQIPSIFIARYPELVNTVNGRSSKYERNPYFNIKDQRNSRSRKEVFKELGGYFRFIVSWDKGFITKRAISHIRTTIEWMNYYENLKKYEIDHKKSSGAYLWIVKMTDPKAFKLWLSLSDEDRKKTGIASKKTPGGTLVLPPGMELEVVNPNLTKISEADTDIMDMVTSGLNEPQDVTTGRAKGTYGSLKASRAPMSDRISDEIAYFDRFLRYDFWGSIFFLKNKIVGFPLYFNVREAVGFTKEGKPKFSMVKKRVEKLIDISYPVSEMIDYESRAKGLLGVKHGPLSEVLGIPYSRIAKKLGFGNYERLRLEQATEKEKYPELVYTVDQESIQERMEGEPKKEEKGGD